ncbi:beta-lactamase-like protein [Zopfochytrium polystomum]|nr:beta-lactamase-like protein [Zopfochytrium polystomum]
MNGGGSHGGNDFASTSNAATTATTTTTASHTAAAAVVVSAHPPPPPPPVARSPTAVVSVSMLAAGVLSLGEHEMYDDADPAAGVRQDIPSLCFLLRHKALGRTAMFDLGIRKDLEAFPPMAQKWLPIFNSRVEKDAAEVLESGGVKADDVDSVILSHIHFDHTGDVRRFPRATVYLSAAAAKAAAAGYPHDPAAEVLAFPASARIVTIESAAASATGDGSATLPSFCGVGRAFDVFGDGSVYAVEAPGHAAGHLALAARVRVATSGVGERWVFMAGDSCHSRACYWCGDDASADERRRPVSRYNHEDVRTAQDTVDRIAAMARHLGPSAATAAATDPDAARVLVVLAHETERLSEVPVFPACLEDGEWAK